MAKTLGEGVLKDVTRLVIETTQKNSATIATITSEFIDVAEGYRIKLKPENQCSLLEE